MKPILASLFGRISDYLYGLTRTTVTAVRRAGSRLAAGPDARLLLRSDRSAHARAPP